MHASLRGHTEIVQILLSKPNIEINSKSIQYFKPLYHSNLIFSWHSNLILSFHSKSCFFHYIQILFFMSFKSYFYITFKFYLFMVLKFYFFMKFKWEITNVPTLTVIFNGY